MLTDEFQISGVSELGSPNMRLQEAERLVTSPKDMTGRDIKALRLALGLSQRKFAKILRVSNMSISRAESGTPTRALILYIERALAEGLLKISDRKVDPESDKKS